MAKLNDNPAVLILAAGKGTRMKSDMPKVLHPLAGRPLLAHVLHIAKELKASRTVVVVGHRADLVKAAFADEPGLDFVVQEPQLGTGHAVMTAAPVLSGFSGDVLILSGDVPGIRLETLRNMLAVHRRQENALTVLAMELDDPGHYGRLLLRGGERLERVVEYRDATEEERAVKLVNSGIYLAQAGPLFEALPLLRTDNDQKEYYLTDMVELMDKRGLRVGCALCPDPKEVAGVNSKDELARLEAEWAGRVNGEE